MIHFKNIETFTHFIINVSSVNTHIFCGFVVISISLNQLWSKHKHLPATDLQYNNHNFIT